MPFLDFALGGEHSCSGVTTWFIEFVDGVIKSDKVGIIVKFTVIDGHRDMGD